MSLTPFRCPRRHHETLLFNSINSQMVTTWLTSSQQPQQKHGHDHQINIHTKQVSKQIQKELSALGLP